MVYEIEGNKIKSEFIKDGVSINDDAVRNALNPNINRDFKLAVKLLKEVPQIKQLTSNQLNKVLIELYHDYLQEEQNDLILIMGKCEELRDLQRGECDFNYYVSYGVCLLTGAASGPFAPAVTVACVGGATAIFINCYNVADRSYQICSR